MQTTNITLESPIEDLDLRFRTYGVLNRAGLKTVEDITRLSIKELQEIHGLGKVGFVDVLVCLDSLGFRCTDCPYEKYPSLRDIPNLHVRVTSNRMAPPKSITTQLYTCDACHYTFPADTLLDRCPDCGKETVTTIIKLNGRERLTSSPAVRPATEAEIASYERVKKEIEEEDRIAIETQQKEQDMLSRTARFITLLLQHNLTTHDHNMALILGYSFLTTPVEYTKNFIMSVLNPCEDLSGFGSVTLSSIVDRYYNYRKAFTSDMQTEKSSFGDMEFHELYSKTWPEGVYLTDAERLLPDVTTLNADTPALNFMKYFNDGEQVICLHTPNLGNVRKIPYKEIAENPSEAYRAFLRDWYNMLCE